MNNISNHKFISDITNVFHEIKNPYFRSFLSTSPELQHNDTTMMNKPKSNYKGDMKCIWPISLHKMTTTARRGAAIEEKQRHSLPENRTILVIFISFEKTMKSWVGSEEATNTQQINKGKYNFRKLPQKDLVSRSKFMCAHWLANLL